MSIDEIVSYYTDLLIIQYRSLVKAKATVDALVRPTVIDQLPVSVQDAFEIDTAIGNQLDTIAKYIGVERRVQTFTDWITLSDDDFRTLIKIKRALNSTGSSLNDIQNFIVGSANNILQVFDSKNMQMSFYINSSYASLILAQALIRQKLLPRPMGVSFSSIVYLPDLSNLFGMQTYTWQSYPVQGFTHMMGSGEVIPFIRYTDAIAIPAF